MTKSKTLLNDNLSRAAFRELSDLKLSVFSLPKGYKEAKMSWKQYQANFPSEEEITAWENHAENMNVAVVTGRQSNLVVLDVDSQEAQDLVDTLALPKTPTVLTGKGRHYYFRFPSLEIRNSVNIKGVKLDVRGEGGYVVGPGSLHPNGNIYRWEVSPKEVSFADMPQTLIDLISVVKVGTSQQQAKAADAFSSDGSPLIAFLNNEIREALKAVENAKEGGRNDALFKAAVGVANHVAALGGDWQAIADKFTAAALTIGLAPAEINATIASAWKSGQASPTKWIEVATNWLYIAGRDLFWSPSTKQFLKPSAFSMNYAHLMTVKGKFASYLTNNGLIECVLDFVYEPTKPTGVFERDGGKFYNSYETPNIAAREGDARLLKEFLAYLVPVEAERVHLEKMIAWTVRNPGKKLKHALLLQSKKHGIGKSTLIDIWRELLGVKNTRKTNSEEMASAYQSYLANTLLVVLEELNLGSGIAAYNKMKDLISEPTVAVNEKFLRQKEISNTANFVLLSNLDIPLLIEQNDRRFFVIDSPAENREADYWTSFHSWWRGNIEVVKWHFDNIDLSEFQPFAPPPMTEAKKRLIRQSEAPLVQELRAMVENAQWPFNKDLFMIDELQSVLKSKGLRRETPQKLSLAAKEIGCKALGQHRFEGGVKLSLWACRNTANWADALPEALRQEYDRQFVALQANDNEGSLVGEAS